MKPSTHTLLIRTLSGIVYVALVIAVLYLGQWSHNEGLGLFVCRVFFLLLAVVGIHEVYHNLGLKGLQANRAWGYALGILCFVVAEGGGMLLPVCVFAVLLMVQLFRHEEHPFETVGYTMLPVLWVALPLSLLPQMLVGQGPHYPMLLFALVWVNDTFAYLCGRTFGKHKMSPRHSPNKTWEGTIGGACFCVLVAVLAGNYIDSGVWSLNVHSLLWLPLGLLVPLFGTAGDLVESMFKRYVGVKDSGKLMPGHGGMLDRFDSMLMVLPFAALYAAFV